MDKRKRYPGIDVFRMIAAFLIVANHTAPLEDISPVMDHLITYCLGRVAVPFFLMVTGYFLLAGYPGKNLKPYLGRLLAMYVLATLFYLPVTIYAGNLPKGLGGWLKWFLMDGSFYHLWYLPAALTGVLITAALLKIGNYWLGTVIVSILYLVGLFGDSWYGAVESIPSLEGFYAMLFSVSSYTRNGFFLAPIFLWLGALLGKNQHTWERSLDKEEKKFIVWISILLGVSILFMMVEGSMTKSIQWQRHDSMYMMLPAVVVLLLVLLLKVRGKDWKFLPSLSMWIYLIHPMCIVVIRAAAGLLNLKWLIVDNSFVFYVAVSISSLAAAICLEAVRVQIYRRRGKTRRLVGKGAGNVSKG